MKYFIFLFFIVIVGSCDDPVTETNAVIQFRVDESIATQVDFPSTIITCSTCIKSASALSSFLSALM